MKRQAARRPIAIFAFGLLIPAAVSASKWDAIEQLPGQTPVSVSVEGNSRVYFRIAPGHPLSVPIDGPSRLRVVTRAELPDRAAVVSYTLTVSDAGHELERNVTESSASDRVSIPGRRAILGKSRRMSVEVPAGHHALSLAATGAPVLVRLQRAAPAAGEEPTVSLTPIEAVRSVLVTEGEKTIPYYTVVPGKPVRLRVVGPTTLDVISRLDFGPTMRGIQSYRLRISDGSATLRQVQYQTTKATTASYRGVPDRLPSKFDRVRLVIPQGLHTIAVDLLLPLNGTAQLHARIPQPTVGGEE